MLRHNLGVQRLRANHDIGSCHVPATSTRRPRP